VLLPLPIIKVFAAFQHNMVGVNVTAFENECISNNHSFRLKHAGVPDGSDGSGGTSYPLTENYMLRVAQATQRVA
jgi:hypothetical protein